jgi:hypothetical protein
VRERWSTQRVGAQGVVAGALARAGAAAGPRRPLPACSPASATPSPLAPPAPVHAAEPLAGEVGQHAAGGADVIAKQQAAQLGWGWARRGTGNKVERATCPPTPAGTGRSNGPGPVPEQPRCRPATAQCSPTAGNAKHAPVANQSTGASCSASTPAALASVSAATWRWGGAGEARAPLRGPSAATQLSQGCCG